METSDSRLDQLTDDMSGVYDVRTDDGAIHCLDLDERAAASFDTDWPPGTHVHHVQLLILATCRVGERMVMLINRDSPGVRFTRRTTAVVNSIGPADPVRLHLEMRW